MISRSRSARPSTTRYLAAILRRARRAGAGDSRASWSRSTSAAARPRCGEPDCIARAIAAIASGSAARRARSRSRRTRPTATTTNLAAWRDAGVNRLSIGVQSLAPRRARRARPRSPVRRRHAPRVERALAAGGFTVSRRLHPRHADRAAPGTIDPTCSTTSITCRLRADDRGAHGVRAARARRPARAARRGRARRALRSDARRARPRGLRALRDQLVREAGQARGPQLAVLARRAVPRARASGGLARGSHADGSGERAHERAQGRRLPRRCAARDHADRRRRDGHRPRVARACAPSTASPRPACRRR